MRLVQQTIQSIFFIFAGLCLPFLQRNHYNSNNHSFLIILWWRHAIPLTQVLLTQTHPHLEEKALTGARTSSLQCLSLRHSWSLSQISPAPHQLSGLQVLKQYLQVENSEIIFFVSRVLSIIRGTNLFTHIYSWLQLQSSTCTLRNPRLSINGLRSDPVPSSSPTLTLLMIGIRVSSCKTGCSASS